MKLILTKCWHGETLGSKIDTIDIHIRYLQVFAGATFSLSLMLMSKFLHSRSFCLCFSGPVPGEVQICTQKHQLYVRHGYYWLSCNPKRIETRLLSICHLAMGNACLHFDEDEEEVTQAGQLEQTRLFWIGLGILH